MGNFHGRRVVQARTGSRGLVRHAARRAAWGWLVVALPLALPACGSSRADPDEGPRPTADECVVVEVQNTSLVGVTVWTKWEDRPARRQGRVSLNEREVYQLPFRNAQLNLQFQPDGGTGRVSSNAVLPTPGDRIDIVYRNNGPSPLRRVGPAQCR